MKRKLQVESYYLHSEKVNEVKTLCAKVIDLLNDLRADQRNEQSRLLSVAITEMQTAQMWAVKAITWKQLIDDQNYLVA